jgi:hypothetical protein
MQPLEVSGAVRHIIYTSLGGIGLSRDRLRLLILILIPWIIEYVELTNKCTAIMHCDNALR